MRFFRPFLRDTKVSYVLAFAVLLLMAAGVRRLNAAGHESRNAQDGGPAPQSPKPQPQDAHSQDPQNPAPNYDKAIFRKPIPSDQLAFLNLFAASASNDVVRDKQYRKLVHSVIPIACFTTAGTGRLPTRSKKCWQVRRCRFEFAMGDM